MPVTASIKARSNELPTISAASCRGFIIIRVVLSCLSNSLVSLLVLSSASLFDSFNASFLSFSSFLIVTTVSLVRAIISRCRPLLCKILSSCLRNSLDSTPILSSSFLTSAKFSARSLVDLTPLNALITKSPIASFLLIISVDLATSIILLFKSARFRSSSSSLKVSLISCLNSLTLSLNSFSWIRIGVKNPANSFCNPL